MSLITAKLIDFLLDINECNEETSGCNQICNNTNGSYTCSCLPGYQLEYDNMFCADVDECAVNNGGCQGACHNLNGSYTCSCPTGYSFNIDHKQCLG